MTQLFDPITIRGTTFQNRAWVSPMCQYSATDGIPNKWHLVHLGSFAVGGAGLVLTESTAVAPIGRISPTDTGLWVDSQIEPWSEIVDFVHSQNTPIGVQLGHAGRKASVSAAWDGSQRVDPPAGWVGVGPTSEPFGSLQAPSSLTTEETAAVIGQFVDSAERAEAAGFDVIEIHAAHGYLLHQYLSPLINKRTDKYGGSFDNRLRLTRDLVAGVREVWPEHKPLFVRISATDWVNGGWDIDQSIELTRQIGNLGVDLIDCSSGGAVHNAIIPTGPGYQVTFAKQIRQATSVLTGAVGMITDPHQANTIIDEGSADAALMAHEFLRQPHWPLLAASELGADTQWPLQYQEARRANIRLGTSRMSED